MNKAPHQNSRMSRSTYELRKEMELFSSLFLLCSQTMWVDSTLSSELVWVTGTKTIQCESLLAKWHWDKWMSTCKRMKLDPILVNSGHQDKIPRLGGLMYFLFWRQRVQDQGAIMVKFWWERFSWPEEGCFLTVSSHSESRRERKVFLPLLIRPQSYWSKAPPL